MKKNIGMLGGSGGGRGAIVPPVKLSCRDMRAAIAAGRMLGLVDGRRIFLRRVYQHREQLEGSMK